MKTTRVLYLTLMDAIWFIQIEIIKIAIRLCVNEANQRKLICLLYTLFVVGVE